MTIGYITNTDGEVVAKFDGRKPSIKDGHQWHSVDSLGDLPSLDNEDTDYLKR